METMSQALHEPAPRQAEPFGAQLTRRAFGRAWTRDDLAQLPADGQRYELVDGILIVSPAPGARHPRVAAATRHAWRRFRRRSTWTCPRTP